jgi:predicted enzyme related to lactoylglutathione lyase
MGERTSHPPGTFNWIDLGTSDPEGAKRFYTSLLGWEAEDMPVPEGPPYTMLRKDGRDAAALYPAQEGQPTAWMSYVSVDSADDTAARAAELGGKVFMEPFDVMDVGRMAMITDPTGAFLAVWQPGTSIGAQVVNEPGALSLNQLTTGDPERGLEFYGELFGWRSEPVEGGGVPYWGIYNGDRLNGGAMHLPPEGGAPAHWLVYFGSADVDADAAKIDELGGQIVLAPTDVPGGRILVAMDPQGGAFGLFSGRFDD